MKRTHAVAKILDRALSATDAEAAAFPFDHTDVAIAQCCLEGMQRSADIAAAVGLTEPALRQRLLDPARDRWIANQLESAVGERLGKVVAAVYSKALVTGDPNRARFLLELYREKKPEKHLHLHANLDLTQLSTEELRAFVKDRKRVLGIEEDEDARPKQDSDRDGGGGPDRPADEGSADGGGEAPPASPRV